MQLRKLFYLLLILPILFLNVACSDDDNGTDPIVEINEAEVLVKYLEANGNVVSGFPKMIKASDVYNNILAGTSQYIIDIRSADHYAAGHIQGAVNVPAGDVLAHYEANNLASYPDGKVIIACYSGQTAGWVNGLLHTLGYTNARDLKWGMCSWNSATSGSWTSPTNVNNSRQAQFVQTETAKPAAGELPVLETGKKTAEEILRARVEAVFAEGFGAAKISSDEVYANLAANFIVNYWKKEHYDWGHIDGAMQYTPGTSLSFDTELKTLTTDPAKAVVVYCYTGQTSAHVSAYLRVLGYNAKSLLFGVNGMCYDNIPANKFDGTTEIHEYPLAQ